jgi:hypothetical protein
MASDRWDALLNGSTWYVPAANLLAFRLDEDSPSRPIPAADQTIWSIPDAEGGRFSGNSVAKIVDASGSVTRSRASMQGVVTRSGQVRIEFTTSGGGTIIGIGQVRRVNGEQAMEMQMITGGGGAFTTHWAYMLPLSANSDPPNPSTAAGDQRAYRSGAYRWLRGSRWSMAPESGDRHTANGRFRITGYRNGYFWGEGNRGPANRPFHVLGSVTPEGNLFFNAIGNRAFQLRISQGGLLKGPRREARAKLRPYSDATGQLKQPLTLRRITTARRDRLTGLAREASAFPSREQQDGLLRHSSKADPKALFRAIGVGQLSASTADGVADSLGDSLTGTGLAVRGLEPGLMAPKGERSGLLQTSDSLAVLAGASSSADHQALGL